MKHKHLILGILLISFSSSYSQTRIDHLKLKDGDIICSIYRNINHPNIAGFIISDSVMYIMYYNSKSYFKYRIDGFTTLGDEQITIVYDTNDNQGMFDIDSIMEDNIFRQTIALVMPSSSLNREKIIFKVKSIVKM